ncbi:MAG: hypothetical protein HY717_08460 [Planctomycetes bacterium]|nr:hypothetical protein [Planctomycetota bacterium]
MAEGNMFDLGSGSLNQKMWNAKIGSYLLYHEPETGKRSEEIMSNQLDGDFASFVKGLEPVFPRDRALTVLDTVKRTCIVDVGAVGVATPEGQPQLTAYGTFPPEIIMLGITYMHYGQRETGTLKGSVLMRDGLRIALSANPRSELLIFEAK